MTPTTRLDDDTLDLRVFAVEAARLCGASTVGELAGVTEAALREKGARVRDVADLRALIVATGGRLADAAPRGRPTGRKTRGATLRVRLDRAQLARLDEVRGERSRDEVAAELLIGVLDRQ